MVGVPGAQRVSWAAYHEGELGRGEHVRIDCTLACSLAFAGRAGPRTCSVWDDDVSLT